MNKKTRSILNPQSSIPNSETSFHSPLSILHSAKNGLTLIEIVIAIALAVLLTTIGIMITNPGGQLAGARNNQRELHLNALMNSIQQNRADSMGGVFTCVSGAIPTTTTKMATGVGNYDIGPCLVPIYSPTMPFDPTTSSAHYSSIADYDTGYMITQNSSTKEIILSAPGAELGKIILIIQ
jgi:prepilin-type N-terminal cleavage/methylation domain-containing protein